VASKASALNLVTAGTAHLLIDFGTQQYPDFPTGLPIVVVWGLTDHIGSQREAVVRFLRALNNAAKFMKTAQPAAIAAVIMKDPDIAQQGTLAQLTAQVAATGYTFVPNDGNISETGWTGALSFAESSGVPGFKASNPQYQYAVRVDMSYLNDANK
jgi:ABC-type nitrate/sulfonate/bicarbonate transport system substrate-binding protein